MDSPFNRQSSLYESSSRQPGSSSIMNSAASSSSRSASPASTASVLGRSNASQSGTPVHSQSRTASLGGAANSAWPGTDAADDGAGLTSNSAAAAAAAPQQQPAFGAGYPGMMGYAYGSGIYGAGSGAAGGSASQFGAQQFGSNPSVASPYAQLGSLGSLGGLYGSSQFGAPYGQLGAQLGGGAPFAYGQSGQSGQGGQFAGSFAGGLGDQRRSSVIGQSKAPSTAGSSPSNAPTAISSQIASPPAAGAGTSSAGAVGATVGANVGTSGVGTTGGTDADEGADEYVSPAAMFWNYIDLNAQEQGPFSGMQMHEWLEYLLDTTSSRRHTDHAFVPFAVLKQVLGTDAPFVVQLTQQGWDAHIQAAQAAHSARARSSLASPRNNDDAPREPQPEPIAASMADSQLSEEPAGRVSAPGSRTKSATKSASKAVPKQPSPSDLPASVPTSNASFTDSVPAPVSASTLNESAFTASVASAAPSGTSVAPAADKKIIAKDGQETRKAEPAEAPTTDPWKKPVRSAQVKISDLKQQALDSKKKKSPDSSTRKSGQGKWMPLEQSSVQIGAEPPALAAPVVSPSSQMTPTASTATFATPAAPAPAPTWGKKSVTPARSLADIQKEQQQQSQSQRPRNASVVSSPVVGGATITMGQLGSKPAFGTKQSTAGSAKTAAAAASAPVEDVKSGRFSALDTTDAATATPTPTARSQTANSTQVVPSTPSPSKPARGVRPQPSSVTARASMASPADELVHWVRVSFKDLVKGVDGMESLEVFSSLGNNKSAREFIADSIYEYSKSLDGRKFASDFLARKKAAEETMGAETWKDVLNRFNPNVVVEQDLSFKVVSKKRTQKIARPGDSI